MTPFRLFVTAWPEFELNKIFFKSGIRYLVVISSTISSTYESRIARKANLLDFFLSAQISACKFQFLIFFLFHLIFSASREIRLTSLTECSLSQGGGKWRNFWGRWRISMIACWVNTQSCMESCWSRRRAKFGFVVYLYSASLLCPSYCSFWISILLKLFIFQYYSFKFFVLSSD